MAIASAGGHWIQLLRLRPAFDGQRVVFATTQSDYAGDVAGSAFHAIPDATRWNKLKLVRCALSIFWLLLRIRPDTVVTTGAAPGYFALRLGRLLRKKTIWIDSVANADELSLSGQKAGACADLWLTQWEHLSRPGGPQFFGSVLGETAEELRPSEAGQDRVPSEATLEKCNDEPSVIGNRESSGTSPDHQSPIKQSERSQITDHRSQITDHRSPITDHRSPITDHRSSKASDHRLGEAPLRIFVTVGSDVPFDRLVGIIDDWAASNGHGFEIFAQVGNSCATPKSFPYTQFLTPDEFRRRLAECDVVVAHAGMGTILSALRYQKPIITLPRHGSLGETRNDHQIATAQRLLKLGIIDVAFDADQLRARLDSLHSPLSVASLSEWAAPQLTERLKSFIAAR